MAYLITGIYTGIILVLFEARLEAIGLGEYDNLFDAFDILFCNDKETNFESWKYLLTDVVPTFANLATSVIVDFFLIINFFIKKLLFT
jgi:hypothetical protein